MKNSLSIVAAAVALTVSLSGCSSISSIRDEPLPGMEKLKEKGTMEFGGQPDIVKISLPPGAFVLAERGMNIPPERDSVVDVEFGDARVDQIVYAVARDSGMGAVYYSDSVFNQNQNQQNGSTSGSSSSSGTSATTERKRISIAFKGKLSDLLKNISSSTGVLFRYENGAIVARETDSFNVVIPTYSEIMKDVTTNVQSMGGTNISFDRATSTMSFTGDANTLGRVKQFLGRMKDNAALVTMRVVVLNVKLDSGWNRGIDWTQVAFGYKNLMQNLQSKVGNTSTTGTGSSATGTTGTATGTTTGTTGTTGTATGTATGTVASAFDMGAAALFTGSGAGVLFETTKFSLQAMLNFMENYGRSEIMQNFFIEAMSGATGKLDVSTETPYVSSVGIGALATGSTATGQTANVSFAKQGVTLQVLPYYSRREGTLSINLNVAVLGVTRMLTLSAGNQLGTLSTPETTKKTIDTFVRMVPSQVLVLGGMVYEQSSKSASGLPLDTYLTKTVGQDSTKEELIVIIKPTIIEFES